jgi:hypothetical protein
MMKLALKGWKLVHLKRKWWKGDEGISVAARLYHEKCDGLIFSTKSNLQLRRGTCKSTNIFELNMALALWSFPGSI